MLASAHPLETPPMATPEKTRVRRRHSSCSATCACVMVVVRLHFS